MPDFDCDIHPSLLLASNLFAVKDEEQRQLIQASIALCAWHEERGDSCVPLQLYQNQSIGVHAQEHHFTWQAPTLDAWQAELSTFPLVNNSQYPSMLTIEDEHLYFHRLYRHECQLSAYLLARRQRSNLEHLDALMPRIQQLFRISEESTISWQLLAAINALSLPLSIISGGPGTGKTSTVAKIIALLLSQSQLASHDNQNTATQKYPHILLAAPTGKAAARMLESLHAQQHALQLNEAETAAFPHEALTLHRLRQQLTYNSFFAIDCLIIDETSMADMSTLNSCLQLLPADCQVILLGDPLQLASVESGSVLIDLCAASEETFSSSFAALIKKYFHWSLPSDDREHQALHGCRIELKQNWRFKDAPGITALSESISQGIENIDAISKEHSDCHYHRIDQMDHVIDKLCTQTIEHFAGIIDCESPPAAIQHLQKCIILCAWKSGALGVQHCNQQLELALRQQCKIADHEIWFHGKPFMVTQNNYDLGIYNGDIGVVWDGRAWIDSGATLKSLPLEDIQDCAPLFAISIHKSQGSQFDHVHVILAERHQEHLSRALYYTAVTRAKQQVSVWSTDETLKHCCNQEIVRHTRLKKQLKHY